jgi:hypothetical protein
MRPPITLMAHFDPRELVWCENCFRLSNSATVCHACGATCGLVSLAELLAPHNAQPSAQDALPALLGCRDDRQDGKMQEGGKESEHRTPAGIGLLTFDQPSHPR